MESGTRKGLTHLDLFSGIGGFTIAAHLAGFQTIGFAEVEPYCCQLLNEKWPFIKNYGDIRRADFSSLRGSVAVLSAGVPCQPASLAGKRRGAADDRWLWPAALDVVRDVEPAWCIFENPDGILSLGEFGGVLSRLAALGYEFRLFGVSANSVGAKHRRQRIFIVANAASERRSGLSIRTEAKNTMFGSNGEALADADRARLEELQSWQAAQCATAIGSGGLNGAGKFEPGICGVADGLRSWLDGTPMPHPLTKERIPNRVARLKALGNAVCPQQVYPFFEAIASS